MLDFSGACIEEADCSLGLACNETLDELDAVEDEEAAEADDEVHSLCPEIKCDSGTI